jgi:hypothetical protein
MPKKSNAIQTIFANILSTASSPRQLNYQDGDSEARNAEHQNDENTEFDRMREAIGKRKREVGERGRSY